MIIINKHFSNYVDILQHPDIRAELPAYANWPTFPQLWVEGELIGGCDIILEMVDEDDDEAMRMFERLMQIRVFKDNLHIIENNLPIDGYGRKNINLFRLRKINENRKYKRRDLFHDPKREENYKKRKPYRYNLAERPSLYLSTTAYCCYKELGSLDNQNIIGAMFRLNSELNIPLYIVDLGNRPIDFIKQNNKYKKANIGYKESEYLFIYRSMFCRCSK